MQAGQLEAQHHGWASPGGGEVAHGTKTGKCCIATHVADHQPLYVDRHAKVTSEQDVETWGGVTSARDDREQTDVRRSEAGVRHRRRDCLFAERHRLFDEALHAGAGAHGADVLVGGGEDAVPGADAGRLPPPPRHPVARVVLVEVALPQGLLVHGHRDGVARAGHSRAHLPPFTPCAWNNDAVDLVDSMTTSARRPAIQPRYWTIDGRSPVRVTGTPSSAHRRTSQRRSMNRSPS